MVADHFGFELMAGPVLLPMAGLGRNICVIAVFSLYLQQKAEREKSRAKVIAARPKPAIGRRTGPAINSKPK
jgi:hypothetical protein